MAGKYPKKPVSRARYPQRRAPRGRPKFLRKILGALVLVLAAALVQWHQSQTADKTPEPSPAQLPLEIATADSFIGQVTRVGDGDSLTVAFGKEGQKIRVRLYGLDAPELDQPHGREARDFLSKLLLNREVRVEKQDIDQYGRVVAQVFDSTLSINLTLVASGQAWVYDQYCHEPICRQMKAEEAQARQKKMGLWGQADPLPPWRWRQSKREPAN